MDENTKVIQGVVTNQNPSPQEVAKSVSAELAQENPQTPETQPISFSTPLAPKRSTNKLLIVGLVFLVIAVIGLGFYLVKNSILIE